jgi:NADH-quinone oxidoreductase subunit D
VTAATQTEGRDGFAPVSELPRGDLHSEIMTLNMGPQHPSTHGVLQIKLKLDGEVVVDLDPVLGYLHRGKEKHSESLSWWKVMPFMDRLDYLAPLQNEIAYALAVERLLGIEVPERAQAIRVAIAECMRLTAHLVWFGTSALEVGAVTPFFLAFREREDLYDLLDELTGLRTNQEYIRFGGVATDVEADWARRLKEWAQRFPACVDEYELLLTGNKIWYDRARGIGVIDAELAMSIGLTGPNLRAAGVPHDLRKVEPYSGYEKYDFDIPVGTKGDVYDRYLVRLEEMRQSARIIVQALEGLPAGEFIARDYRYVLPPKDRVYSSMEELIYQFKIVTDMRVPKGEAYQAIEAAKGELGIYIVSDGGTNPFRMHVRAPSFVNMMAIKPTCIGRPIADVVAIVGSIDFVMGECDR